MKKVVVLFLTVCILVGALTGCGGKDGTTSQTDKTQAEQVDREVAVGTILDAPEVQFDTNTEELYVYFTYPGDKANETASMEIAVDQVTDDTYLIYTTDGLLKNHELIYEVTDAGVTKYYKDAFMDRFEQETEATQQQVEKEKNEILSLLSYFMMQHSDYAGFQYRKSDKRVAELTGEVYVYDVLENNECIGQICIDKATGLMVSLKDIQGNSSFTVQKFQISNVEIPAYK
ncbi:MAG: hypothetical protein E7531_03755 [Ruminococcaceae bacterium]|nr:hypothetical protein [Oscillospiraceae bacterium]